MSLGRRDFARRPHGSDMNNSRRGRRRSLAAAEARNAPLRRAARVWLVAALIIVYVVLTSCGGSSAGDSVGHAQAQSPPTPTLTLTAAQQAAADKVYAGLPRTPPGFLSDPPPAGALGSVSTLHLKNTDTAAVVSTRYELCSDDVAEAISWSETKTVSLQIYADLIESNSSARAFELVRVPRNDSTARLRHRVFRCTYLDRSNTDLASDTGPAGVVRQLPFDPAALQDLSEYLWQFTTYNNADHVVLQSAAVASGANDLAHAIDMARLTRGATAADCDRIDLLRWTHTLNIVTGALRRQLDTVGSFSARRANGVVQSCMP